MDKRLKQGQPARTGDIVTYDGASDEFLQRHKEELRAGLHHRNLTAGEFVRDVLGQVAIATFAAGLTAWNVVERTIKWKMNNEDPKGWWHQKVAIFKDGKRTSVYVSERDVGTYQGMMNIISRHIASTFFENGGKKSSFSRICRETMKMAEHFGFQAGFEDLKKLHDHLNPISRLADIPAEDQHMLQGLRDEFKHLHPTVPMTDERLLEAYKCRKLYLFLGELIKKDNQPNSGIGQLHKVWKRMGDIVGNKASGRKAKLPPNEMILGSDAFVFEDAGMVRSAIENDNKLIIGKWRNPATVIVAGTAALVTGIQAYRFATRQKSLDQESELSYIERLEAERAEAKDRSGTGQHVG